MIFYRKNRKIVNMSSLPYEFKQIFTVSDVSTQTDNEYDHVSPAEDPIPDDFLDDDAGFDNDDDESTEEIPEVVKTPVTVAPPKKKIVDPVVVPKKIVE